jgi:DNA-dependent protein kinase catalytic subunit
MEAKDVRRMFIIIIERCEQIFFSNQQQQQQQQQQSTTTTYSSGVQHMNEIFDEKIYQLPSFIESLSYICNEIDDLLPEGSINTLEKLVILAIDNYPKLIKRYNRAISVALIRLLISIQLNKSVYYRDFTSKIIYQSLIRIFSYKTVYRVQLEQQQQQQQHKPDYQSQQIQTDINTITSKDYVELWSNLLNLQQYEELNAVGINAQEKKQLVKIIYDEYMESIMKIIKKLDLNAIKNVHDSQQNQSPTKLQQQVSSNIEQNDFLSSNPLNNLKAMRPRDFEILINLVDFTRELLTNKHLKLFEKWLFKFSKEIIFLSSKYPFISGFYKLVTLCMRIAIKIGYFKVSL